LVATITIALSGYTLAMSSIKCNSINATGVLVQILVLDERHLRRTCRPTFRRQIKHEIVSNQFEKSRSKHRIGVVDLSISISLEDGNSGEILRPFCTPGPRFDVVVHAFCTGKATAFGNANIFRETVAACGIDIPNPVVGFNGRNEAFIFALGNDAEGHESTCLDVEFQRLELIEQGSATRTSPFLSSAVHQVVNNQSVGFAKQFSKALLTPWPAVKNVLLVYFRQGSACRFLANSTVAALCSASSFMKATRASTHSASETTVLETMPMGSFPFGCI
jgi:hypothetical protein